MDKILIVNADLAKFKESVEGKEDSEIVLISVENLKWLIATIEVVKEYNKMYLDRIVQFRRDEERIKKEEGRLNAQADLLRKYKDSFEKILKVDSQSYYDDLQEVCEIAERALKN